MVRHKNRYILIQVKKIGKEDTTQFKLHPKHIYNKIQEQLQKLHGDFGVAATKAGFAIKYCNENTKIAVVKVRRGPHRLVASVLPLIKTMDMHRVRVDIIYIGAQIRQSFLFLKDHQEKKFNDYCAQLKSDEEKRKLKELMLNFDTFEMQG